MYLEVHTSDRTSFKRCRQRWDFSSNLRMNLEPKTPIEPLWFGTAIHEALAAYYDPEGIGPKPALSMNAFNQYINDWKDQLEAISVDQEEWAEEMRTKGTAMLAYYFQWAPKHDDFEVIFVEKPFIVDIPRMPGVTYSLRLDGLVKDKEGRYWILEHKTTASFPEQEEWLVMDDQCGSYLWALTQLDEPIYAEGVIYNSLKKKAPSPLRKLKNGGYSIAQNQDTTFEVALTTLREEYGKVPRRYWDFLDYLKYKPDNFIKRQYVRRNRSELDRLGESLWQECLDMVNDPAIYRTPSRINCTGCPFIAPCMAKWEGSDYEWLLEQNYRSRKP